MKKILKNKKVADRIKTTRHGLRIIQYILMAVIILTSYTVPVSAADPLTAINTLSTFIFSAIKAIGMILLGFGIVQIGLSLKSHDAQQRANGFLTFFGGVIIAFAKDILDTLV
jgi:hypothetical protein